MKPKPIVVSHWVARIIAAGILLMGALPKFTGGAGALAEKLPGGTATVLAIGVAELVAIVLMFIPKATLVGSALAAAIMIGAIGATSLGPSEWRGSSRRCSGWPSSPSWLPRRPPRSRGVATPHADDSGPPRGPPGAT